MRQRVAVGRVLSAEIPALNNALETFTLESLKSNSFVKLVAASKKEGKTSPIPKTLKESTMAKIINPMVMGSFNKRKLISEKADARISNRVVNSSTSIVYNLTTI